MIKLAPRFLKKWRPAVFTSKYSSLGGERILAGGGGGEVHLVSPKNINGELLQKLISQLTANVGGIIGMSHNLYGIR